MKGPLSLTGERLGATGRAGTEDGEEKEDEESLEWSEEISIKVMGGPFTSLDMPRQGLKNEGDEGWSR